MIQDITDKERSLKEQRKDAEVTFGVHTDFHTGRQLASLLSQWTSLFGNNVSIESDLGVHAIVRCQHTIWTLCGVLWAYRMRSRGKVAMKPASTRIGLRCQRCSRKEEEDLGARRPGARHGETDIRCSQQLLEK